VEVGGKLVVAVLDTGAERSVFDISLLPEKLMKANIYMGTVKLIFAFGLQVIAKLANVPCKFISSGMMYEPCIISVAVADDLASWSLFLLSLSYYRTLISVPLQLLPVSQVILGGACVGRSGEEGACPVGKN